MMVKINPQRQRAIDKINEIKDDKIGMLKLTGKYYWKQLKRYKSCMVEAICDCGNYKDFLLSNFSKGMCKSCGCAKNLMISNARSNHRKHKDYKYFAPYFMKQITKHLNRGNDRKLSCSLTIKQLDDMFDYQNGLCYFSEEPLTLPDFSLGYKYYESNFNVSIDRLNNFKGYHKNNCVLCTKEINQMKMDMSVSRFVELCSLVSSAQSGRQT